MPPSPLRSDVPLGLVKVVDRLSKKAAPKMRKALRKALENAAGDFAELLKTLDPVEALAVEKTWDDLLSGLVAMYGEKGPLLDAMIVAGEEVANSIEAQWSFLERGFADRASLWLADHGAKLVTGVTGETRKAIKQVIDDSFTGPKNLRQAARELVNLPALGLDRVQMAAQEKAVARILAKGYSEDWTASQTQFAINQDYKRRLYARARKIAITESSNAGNASVDLAIREAVERGLIDKDEIELEWVTRAVNACPICEALDGARRPLNGGLFVSRVITRGKLAGKRVSFERPTVHPHCYCGMRTVRREEKRLWGWRVEQKLAGPAWVAHPLEAV